MLEELNEVSPQGSVQIPESERFTETEWCFQFFNNEPVVFGWSEVSDAGGPLVIKLEPVKDEALTFSQNGMQFRIFPREMSEDTKEKRAQQSNEKINQQ